MPQRVAAVAVKKGKGIQMRSQRTLFTVTALIEAGAAQ